MITTFTAELVVTDLNDATEQATQVWREFSNNPTADLHWSTVAAIHRSADGTCKANITIKVNDKGQ